MTVSRSSDRQRIFIAGRLTFGGGVMSVPCNVRDLSDHGARVTLDARCAASPWLRVTVIDAAGKRAWSNPIWV